MSYPTDGSPGSVGRRRARPARDQHASSFNLLLEELILAQPFVRAAALFDSEGETVDYAGELDPFDMKVAAATFGTILTDLRTCARLSKATQISVLTNGHGYVLRLLDPTYSLLLVVRRLATFGVSARVLTEIEARLLEEACIPVREHPTWFRVQVVSGARGRPIKMRPAMTLSEASASWVDVEVLGAHVGLHETHKAYRARLEGGVEVTLLRERRSLWFVDEQLDPDRLRAPLRGADLFGLPVQKSPKTGR